MPNDVNRYHNMHDAYSKLSSPRKVASRLEMSESAKKLHRY
jgi:hypothetical protein